MAVLGGSPTHGLADAYSDLDTLVYWDKLDVAHLSLDFWDQTTAGVREGSETAAWVQKSNGRFLDSVVLCGNELAGDCSAA